MDEGTHESMIASFAPLLAASILEELDKKESPATTSDRKSKSSKQASDSKDKSKSHHKKKSKKSSKHNEKKKHKSKSKRDSDEKSKHLNESVKRDKEKHKDRVESTKENNSNKASDHESAVIRATASDDLVVVDNSNRELYTAESVTFDKHNKKSKELEIGLVESRASTAEPEKTTVNPSLALPSLEADDKVEDGEIVDEISYDVNTVSDDVTHAIDMLAQTTSKQRKVVSSRKEKKPKKVRITDTVIDDMDRKMDKMERKIKGKNYRPRHIDEIREYEDDTEYLEHHEKRLKSSGSRRDAEQRYYERHRSRSPLQTHRSRSYSPEPSAYTGDYRDKEYDHKEKDYRNENQRSHYKYQDQYQRYDYRRRREDDRERLYREHRSISEARTMRSSSVVSSRSALSTSTTRTRRTYTRAERIDKAKLLAIARENLAKMIQSGTLPGDVPVDKFKLRHLKELSNAKSVHQYTEFCRAISAMEAAAYSDSSLSGSDIDSDDDVRSVISQVTFDGRHPFALKERKEIQIRVRDFAQLPARSAKELQTELREQFPVSSGKKHHIGELEWREVDPLDTTTPSPLAIMPPPMAPAPKAKKKTEDRLPLPTFIAPAQSEQQNIIGPVQPPSESPTQQTKQPVIDIGSIMAQRLGAMRVLQDDPLNVVALKQMQQAQEMVTISIASPA